MSVSVKIVLIVLSAIAGIVGMWITGYLVYLYRKKHRPHISGRLVIFFDEDLGDVEKMDKVVLRIEKIE